MAFFVLFLGLRGGGGGLIFEEPDFGAAVVVFCLVVFVVVFLGGGREGVWNILVWVLKTMVDSFSISECVDCFVRDMKGKPVMLVPKLDKHMSSSVPFHQLP